MSFQNIEKTSSEFVNKLATQFMKNAGSALALQATITICNIWSTIQCHVQLKIYENTPVL